MSGSTLFVLLFIASFIARVVFSVFCLSAVPAERKVQKCFRKAEMFAATER